MHCLNIKLSLSCSCKPYHLTCTQTSNTAHTDYVHNQSILRGKGGKGRGCASNLSTSCSVRASLGVRLGHVKHITSNKGEGMWWANEKAVMADKVNTRLLSTSLQCIDSQPPPPPPHTHTLPHYIRTPPTHPQLHSNTGWEGTHMTERA